MNTNDDTRMETQAQGLIGLETTRVSRRRMLKGSGAALAALGLLGTTGFGNTGTVHADEQENAILAGTTAPKPRIVLVHGAWADGTGWQHVIPLLEKANYDVIAVQNPLTSLVDDVATTKRVIDAETQKGPVVVVGHSYGGAVITGAAAGNPNVKGLVYIAAFAPDVGEPIGALLQQYPTALGTSLVADAAGVGRTEASVMAAAQKPAFGGIFAESLTEAAWKTVPSWYMVATNDHVLSPDMERFLAKRMHAKTIEINSSHVPFITKPHDVFKLIDKAARIVR